MHIASDYDLACTLMRNAHSFLSDAPGMEPVPPDIALHHLAIALELGLKSLLLDRGYSDDWMRRHLRHDLGLALFHATANGLRDVPRPMAIFIDQLGQIYQSHAFGSHTIDRLMPALLGLAYGNARILLADIASLTGARDAA